MQGFYPYYGAAGSIDSVNSYKFEGYHLLVAEDGTVTKDGTHPMLQLVDGKFWVSNHAHVLQGKTKQDTLLLYYMLNNVNINKYITGAVQPKLSKRNLLNIKILLPPLPEQKAIAEVLSSLDDKIDLLHRQNKTLENMAQTLFQKWFIEDADEAWEIGTISDEFDFTMGHSPPGDSYNEEGIGVPMFQGNADFGFRFPQNRVYTTKPKRFAEMFDTLISVRAPVGAQNMAKERCCIGRGVACFRYRHNPKCYTYTYFKLKSLMSEIKKFNDSGTVFGSISKTDFDNMKVTLPPQKIVQQYEHEVASTSDKITKNYYQIDMLKNLQDTLAPKLLNGKARVLK